MTHIRYITLLLTLLLACAQRVGAQELQATVTVNHNAIQGTDTSVFDDLQTTLTNLLNDTQWTSLQFQTRERIRCTFALTVTKHESNTFTCKAVISAIRPVYNSQYTTTTYSNTDNDFTFEYAQFDQLSFNENTIDNQLVALAAYYALLIIGIDLDSFGLLSGEDVLQRCFNLVNNAQNLDFPGWKAFDSSRNRYAIINDYLDGAMEPFRRMQYTYYREGLDEMAANADRGRTAITTAILEQLYKASKDRPLSMLPQIWTDYKRDEIANIYNGKGTSKEKENVYDVLFSINASQSNAWEKIKK